MHAFLIAMNVWGLMVVLGLLLSLKDGDQLSGAAVLSSSLSLVLAGWAFALLVQGH